MTYQLTRKAEGDVYDIYRYSLENYGMDVAGGYARGLHECFGYLSEYCGIGKDFSHIHQGLHHTEKGTMKVILEIEAVI